MRPSLAICIFCPSEALAQSIVGLLEKSYTAQKTKTRYECTPFDTELDFFEFVSRTKPHTDCLIVQRHPTLPALLDRLREQALFFPIVILQPNDTGRLQDDSSPASPLTYHSAMVELQETELNQLIPAIDQAINQFLQLTPTGQLANAQPIADLVEPAEHHSLLEQQSRLAEKLKARLGYLGVYYKRNPQNFLRHMTQPQREELLQQLKREYRDIILTYFSNDQRLNQRIDNFVNTAFFSDVSVSHIVEIHMELIDEFSKQLKLEGRSDEMLQDYRLTLIDTLAHLCEMYRRSIPRES